jgi:CelD/BcsL family acetyltransferase involved in cellulose biosynthesis/SAM-dependent methyltransferase
MALDVGVVSDIAGLETLEAAWWDLFDASAEATPFQSPAWLIAWWRAFHPGDLRTIVVRDGDRLVGLAPFYIERTTSGGRLLAMGIGTSDYLDVLVAPDCSGQALAAIGAAVEALPGWQEWELTDMAPFAAGRGLPALSGCTAEESLTAARHVLALTDDPAALLPTGKSRKLRMAEHRARRDGGHTIHRADAGSLDRLLTWLIDLHRRRWTGRGETGVFADPRVERCHREALPRLLRHGMLRLYGLERNGVVTAVQLGFQHRRRAFAYVAGFDPADAQVSPGTLLTAHAIREAQREGCRWFDFLKGEEAHKQSWGARGQEAFRRVWRRRGDDAVALLASGQLPANVALMRLAYRARSAAEVEAGLARAEAAADDVDARRRLAAAGVLWRASPRAFTLVEAVRDEVEATSGDDGDAVKDCARLFDRACRHAPDGAAALYALGRGDILERATDEIVALLEARGLLDRRMRILDLGCGSGRIAAALAGKAAQVVAVDISAGMLAAARRRLGRLANVMLVQGSGRDLAWLADQAVDLVLAVDVFPYLVKSGPTLVAETMSEVRRVLRPAGSLVVLNWSYRGDPQGDRRQAAAEAERLGLLLQEQGPAGFAFWDASLHHLVRPVGA